MTMTLDEVDRCARTDHRALVLPLGRVEAACSAALRGAGDRAELAEALFELRRVVQAHLLWEEDELLAGARPVPSGARIARLLSAHGEISAVLDFCVTDCAGTEHVLLARRGRDLVALLREEIRREEADSFAGIGSEAAVTAVDAPCRARS
jgi:hypothetical protein